MEGRGNHGHICLRCVGWQPIPHHIWRYPPQGWC